MCQEDKPDKEGVGQSQMEESSTGHTAQTTAPQETQGSKRQRDDELKKQQKPGESDIQRSLGDINEPVKKKLKTVDAKDDGNEDEGEELDPEKSEEAEMYKHIKVCTIPLLHFYRDQVLPLLHVHYHHLLHPQFLLSFSRVR